MERITQERLDELRASTPHCAPADIETTFGPGATPEQIEDFTAYLRRYAAPKPIEEGWITPGRPCLVCNEVGSFEWGLQHGEGHCTKCHWPATLYHFVNDRNGKELVTIRGLLLQYHPDQIRLRTEAA